MDVKLSLLPYGGRMWAVCVSEHI